MSLRGLLVLVLALAIAVALLVGLGRGKRAAAPEAAEAPLLAAFAEASIRQIDVSCEGSSMTIHRTAGGAWTVAAPAEVEADPRRVGELISALQDAKARKAIAPGGSDPAAFGLDPAVCRLTVGLQPGAGERTLRLGRTSPVGTERYASGDGGAIALTDGSLYAVVARRADAYRERRLIPLPAEAMTTIAIDRPGERLVLAQEDGTWRIERPLADRASASACSQLARAIAALELDAVGAAVHPIEARTDRRIGIEVSARGIATPRTAFVARAGVEGRRVAWRDEGALTGLVGEAEALELERPAEAFRDKRVVTFSSPDVRWVEVRRGAGVLRLEREGEGSGWTGREGAVAVPLDGDRVNELLERLRVVTSVGFGPAVPPSAETGTMVVGGASGAMATLAWGAWPPDASGTDESFWVTTPSRPGVVFKVVATDLGPIPAHARDLAPAGAPGTTGDAS